jgi:UDP-N-acetylglucosamine 2-epimerase (non-hydrolysing)
MKGLRLIKPLGYLDFLKRMSDARLVLTDSGGGIQEDTTILNEPCLTFRENTEPIRVGTRSNPAERNPRNGNDPQVVVRQRLSSSAPTF